MSQISETEAQKGRNYGGLGPSFRGCGSVSSTIPWPSVSSPRPPSFHPVRQLPNQRRLHFHPFPHLLRPNLPLHLRPSTSHLPLILPNRNRNRNRIALLRNSRYIFSVSSFDSACVSYCSVCNSSSKSRDRFHVAFLFNGFGEAILL
ncbi:hypothetical protein SDJN03_10838, partial [Cucurbita argyrosperma subsp. sororia]